MQQSATTAAAQPSSTSDSAAAVSASSSTAAASATAAPAAAPAAAAASTSSSRTPINIPDDADPLDYLDQEKLKAAGARLPTTQEGINKLFDSMPITASVMPAAAAATAPATTAAAATQPQSSSSSSSSSSSTATAAAEENLEFRGLRAIIDETDGNTRAENFKDSGNEAYKLALKMRKDYAEAMKKREEEEERRRKEGLPPAPAGMSEEQQRKFEEESKHLLKLKEAAEKRLRDAVEYYTQALEVELPVAQGGQAATLTAHLKTQLFTNRAQVQIALENYGRAQADADAAMKIQPRNAKAAFRGATAALACNPPKWQKAQQYVTAAVDRDEKRKKIDWQFRAEQQALEEMQRKIDVLRAREEEQKRKEEEKVKATEEADALYSAALTLALRARGLKIGPLAFRFADTPYLQQTKEPGRLPRPMLHPPPPAPYTAATTLSWPLLLLYPEEQQSDFVAECAESARLIDVLTTMFPPSADYAPWDDKRRYRVDNLSVWIDARGPNAPHDSSAAEDAAARVLVNPQHTLQSILSNPKLQKKGYVIPGIPTFIVLPKQ